MKKITLFFAFVLAIPFAKAQATDQYLGQIAYVAFNYAPKGWAFCDGQILPINGNQALFSLLGTRYGGNGTTTFALPDMRGRVLVGDGAGPGLTDRKLGERGGEEKHTLITPEMPVHNHTVNAVTAAGNTNSPTGALPADTKSFDKEYSTATANTTMNTAMISNTGGGQPHNNMQPYLTLKCIIALTGVYPSRN